MSPVLGSRNRFLFRVLIYAAAPLLGLFVFLDNPDDLRGRVIGGLAIVAGATALVLLIARLNDPWGAIRYAVRPVPTLRTILAEWFATGTDDAGWVVELQDHLDQKLPDIAVDNDDSADAGVLTLGEELLLVADRRPATTEARDRLLERVETLRSPLADESIVVVLASDGNDGNEVDLSMLQRARRIHVLRVPSA